MSILFNKKSFMNNYQNKSKGIHNIKPVLEFLEGKQKEVISNWKQAIE